MNGIAEKYTHFAWKPSTLKVLRAQVGDCRSQTAFEFTTLLLLMITFSDVLSTSGAIIKGDNLSSLNEALRLKSTTACMNTVSREIAWRKVVHRWQFELHHLPAEMNDEADALSRLKAVPKRKLPEAALQTASFASPPSQTASLWKARISYD